LYGDEDEEKSIRMAVEEAEKAWRAKDSGEEKVDASGAPVVVDDEATKRMLEDVVGGTKGIAALTERCLDAVLEACFTWEVSPVARPPDVD
jgi:hypothetical protein